MPVHPLKDCPAGDKEPHWALSTGLLYSFRLLCLLLASPFVERNVEKRNGALELHTVGAMSELLALRDVKN